MSESESVLPACWLLSRSPSANKTMQITRTSPQMRKRYCIRQRVSTILMLMLHLRLMVFTQRPLFWCSGLLLPPPLLRFLSHTHFLSRPFSLLCSLSLCPSVSLSLSMVVSKALVSRNGGSMSIFSAGNGQGTTVTLKFPVYRWAVE